MDAGKSLYVPHRIRAEEVTVTTRTHFTFRVDTWTADGESIVEHVAGVEVARPQFPQAKVPLKKFGEVAKLNPLRSRNCLAPKILYPPRSHAKF